MDADSRFVIHLEEQGDVTSVSSIDVAPNVSTRYLDQRLAQSSQMNLPSETKIHGDPVSILQPVLKKPYYTAGTYSLSDGGDDVAYITDMTCEESQKRDRDGQKFSWCHGNLTLHGHRKPVEQIQMKFARPRGKNLQCQDRAYAKIQCVQTRKDDDAAWVNVSSGC